MKVAVIVYHKNLNDIYPAEWIEKFKHSILNQTYRNFKIYEYNYGGGQERIFDDSHFYSAPEETFIHAMNYILQEATRHGHDCVANTNVDDWYATDRFEKQIHYIEQQYDIVSSNFSLVEDDKIIKTHAFEKLDLPLELSNNHNPVCHPAVMYSKYFLQNNKYVPEQGPLEDLMLWQRSIKKGFKFIILPDVLCFHRLHDNSVCQSENK